LAQQGYKIADRGNSTLKLEMVQHLTDAIKDAIASNRRQCSRWPLAEQIL